MTRLNATIQTLELGGSLWKVENGTTTGSASNSHSTTMQQDAVAKAAHEPFENSHDAKTKTSSNTSRVSASRKAFTPPPRVSPFEAAANGVTTGIRDGGTFVGANETHQATSSIAQKGSMTAPDTQSTGLTPERARLTAQTVRGEVDSPDSPPLPMLHHRDFFWDGAHVDAPMFELVDPNSNIYKLGDKVYCTTGSTLVSEDIMICNKDLCDKCRDHTAPPLEDARENAALGEGLPFVHCLDCAPAPHGQYFWFLPKIAHPYTAKLPKHVWRTVACFRMQDGRQMLMRVMMCDWGLCDVCSLGRHAEHG